MRNTSEQDSRSLQLCLRACFLEGERKREEAKDLERSTPKNTQPKQGRTEPARREKIPSERNTRDGQIAKRNKSFDWQKCSRVDPGRFGLLPFERFRQHITMSCRRTPSAEGINSGILSSDFGKAFGSPGAICPFSAQKRSSRMGNTHDGSFSERKNTRP